MSAPGPLGGLRVVITRERAQAEPWLNTLSELGMEALSLPMLEFVACEPAALDAALDAFTSYDWIVFTSANAVRFVTARCRMLGLHPARLGEVQIAAVGGATAESLRAAGVGVTLTASGATGRGLAAELIARGVAGQRVWLPSARAARPELRNLLRAAGAIVEVTPVYDTVAPTAPDPHLLRALRSGAVDVVVLASPSAARNLRAALGGTPAVSVQVVCIGATTADTARELGYRVAMVARVPSATGLTEALIALCNAHGTP